MVAYTPACNRTAELLARLGVDDAEIAQVLGISGRVFGRWVKEYPELAAALQKGRVLADAKVAAALYKRAVGYSVKTVKVFQYQGQPVPVDVAEMQPVGIEVVVRDVGEAAE